MNKSHNQRESWLDLSLNRARWHREWLRLSEPQFPQAQGGLWCWGGKHLAQLCHQTTPHDRCHFFFYYAWHQLK
jgi:hypothetical protein